MPDQVQEFLQLAGEEIAAPAEAQDPGAPKVPFASNLRLTGQQEKAMIEHAFKRLTELEKETGRDQTISPTWWQNMTAVANSAISAQGLTAADTFLGKRSRFDATFMNDFSWRLFTSPTDSIFQSSNFATPVVRRVCRQMIARAKNSFFGAEPWFSVDPAPVIEYDPINDAARADKIEKFCRFKMKESGSKAGMERAIERACVLGECVVKTTYVVRDQIFNTDARVLTDVSGEPVRAVDGNFITEGEEFVDKIDELGVQKRVLKRDGVTEEPLAGIWQTRPLDRRQVLFEGTKSTPIYYKDFLCPLTAEDVQQADTCIHFYDQPVAAFVDMMVKRGQVGSDNAERTEAARKMVALVKALSQNSSAPKAAVASDVRPNENYGSPPTAEASGPVAEFAEFYLWFDANGDGVAENIMLICDRKTRAPVFYDHIANVTTDGLRPLEVVRINPVDGRWYGQGIMELFDSYQTQIDLLANRWNFSQSRSGRVELWTPTNTLEGELNPDLKMNFGGTYTKKPGMKKEDVLEVIYLTDVKFEQIHTQMQFYIQLLMNESGVSNANDDQAAGMQSAKLATGILEVKQSGDELFRPIVSELKGPLERIVNREVDVILVNLNPVEVFTYLEGNTQGVDRLTPDEVRGLRFKCEISLTSDRNQEKQQIAEKIILVIEKFFAQLPEVQMRTAFAYKKLAAALDPTVDVEKLFVPVMPVVAAPGGGAPGSSGEPLSNDTPFKAQLGQKSSQMEGMSAPGGTPAAA